MKAGEVGGGVGGKGSISNTVSNPVPARLLNFAPVDMGAFIKKNTLKPYTVQKRPETDYGDIRRRLVEGTRDYGNNVPMARIHRAGLDGVYGGNKQVAYGGNNNNVYGGNSRQGVYGEGASSSHSYSSGSVNGVGDYLAAFGYN